MLVPLPKTFDQTTISVIAAQLAKLQFKRRRTVEIQHGRVHVAAVVLEMCWSLLLPQTWWKKWVCSAKWHHQCLCQPFSRFFNVSGLQVVFSITCFSTHTWRVIKPTPIKVHFARNEDGLKPYQGRTWVDKHVLDGWTLPINSMAPLNVTVACVFLWQNSEMSWVCGNRCYQ